MSPRIPPCSQNLKRLKCLKKNEISKDEIFTVIFQAVSENRESVIIPSIIQIRHDFKKAGDIFDMNIRIPMSDIALDKVFFIMIYEKDNPALFDPDDPIGLIAFYSNGVIAAYSGNFYNFPKPGTYEFSYDQDLDITLDAGNDGKYLITIDLSTEE